MKAEDIMARAKTRLLLNQPFFFSVVARLEVVEATWCQTAATDGVHLFFNREFIEKLTVPETVGLLIHEGLHVAWLHPLRRGDRNPKIANIAMDIAINQTIIDAKVQLPATTLHGPQFDKYKDWNWERIYEDLLKNSTFVDIEFDMPDDGKGGGEEGKVKVWGGVVDPTNENGKELSQAERTELEEEIKLAVKEAAEAAKKRGNLPAGMEGLVEAIGKPKINWKDYIQSWVKGHKPDDYTWSRPNRNMMIQHGVYMPRMQMNGAGIGVLSIDTSGSVSDEELRAYVREIAGVVELCNPEKLIIIQHDAVIQSISEWEAGEDFKSLKVKGRGGTCIRPVFDHIQKLDDEINWMIVFTDGEIGDYPPASKQPPYPVLFCITGPDTSPFGTYLDLRKGI